MGSTTDKNNVYFYYKNPDDTLRQYSFGAQPESMTSQTVRIPVRLSGLPSKKAQEFKVTVDPASTAKAGVHYKDLSSTYSIAPDSVNGEVDRDAPPRLVSPSTEIR